MKKFFGILFSFIVLAHIQTFAAETSSSFIRDDLKFDTKPQVMQKSTLQKNENNTISELGETAVKKIDINEKVLNYTLNPVSYAPLIPQGIIYQESQKFVDAIDPKKQASVLSYYPGLRGPNQLVIYTPSYGLRTGTNEYGTEAVVENNMVVRLNGADSVIPKNGFVISGHGSAKNWILKNIQIGSKVYVDYSNNSIKVFLTPESLVFAAKEKAKEVSSLIEYYRQIDILYNDKKAMEFLESSKDSMRKAEKKPEKTQSYINEAMEYLDNAIKNAIPYYANEMKGIWVRPVETNSAGIEKTVEKLHKAGITDIFLETYFHGKTIYPSKYMKECGVIWQREEFKGFDPLKIWISEAHKHGMRLHIWFETFYVGNDNPQAVENHVLKVYPLWSNKRLMNYDSEEPVFSLSEHNGYFLDPSNIQVQTYLLGILKEIIDNYNPDGINLDYIRYPQTVEPSYSNYAQTNWGYTYSARNEFKNLYGIDPIDIKYGTGDWELWSLYRQNQISEFVKEVKRMTKNSDVMLTAVIFPDLKKCIATKMQNWKVWSLNNYVDGFTPLILTGDKNTATLLLKDVTKNTAPATKIYPGLFVTFMGGPFEDLLMQIHKTREFKTRGTVIFDYAHLDDVYVDALTTRVFNKTYDSKEYAIKTPQNYKPELKYKEKKKKKKRFWRRNNDND